MDLPEPSKYLFQVSVEFGSGCCKGTSILYFSSYQHTGEGSKAALKTENKTLEKCRVMSNIELLEKSNMLMKSMAIELI